MVDTHAIRRRQWVIGGLVFCAILLFWPLLNQPFIRDDIDIQWTLSRSQYVPGITVFRDLLTRCMLPHFFRPLSAPVFYLFYQIFGLSPAPLRAAIILLTLWNAYLIGKVCARLSENDSTGFFAGGLYMASWMHWSCVSMTANLPATIAHVLFWQSMYMFLRVEASRGIAATLYCLLPVTLGLGFKEDVIVFPLFLLGRLLWMPRSRQGAKGLYFIMAAWTGLYLAGRIFLSPNSFLSEHSYFRLDIANLLTMRSFSSMVSLFLEQLRHPFLTQTSWAGLLQWIQERPGYAVSWLCVGLLLGYGLGRCAWSVTTRQNDAGPVSAKSASRLAGLGLCGFIIGGLPYWAFGAVNSWAIHRFTLSLSALCVGLGPMAFLVSRRLVSKGLWTRWVYGGFGMLVMLTLAVAYRFPDPTLASFVRLRQLSETRQAISHIQIGLKDRLHHADRLVFCGFDPDDRIPALFEALHGKPLESRREIETCAASAPTDAGGRSWSIERRVLPDRMRLIIQLMGQEAEDYSWPRAPVL